ncbi:hypothetical protein TeGR_g2572 [Tetraparma gracilis]|nr:hypothetical protein TeGR_g2572 [Tetraparma gracilis]
MVDEIVTRNTVHPVALTSYSGALSSSFSTFRFNGHPVKLHLDDMTKMVEERIEQERRQICRQALDGCISKIKRKNRVKEPSRVLRFLDHTDAYHRAVSSTATDKLAKEVERRDKSRRFRESVSRGDFLPPLEKVDIDKDVAEHLFFATAWLEKEEITESALEKAAKAKKKDVEEFPAKFGPEKEKAEKALQAGLDKRRKEAIETALAALKGDRSKELERKKASYNTPENPLPPSLASDWEQETKGLLSEKTKGLNKEWGEKGEREKAELADKMEKKRVLDLTTLEDGHDKKIKVFVMMMKKLVECKPGFSVATPGFFRPPELYRSEHIVPVDARQMNASRTWPNFVDECVKNPYMNYLADNILVYLPEKDYAGTLSMVSKSFNNFSKYFKDRCVHTTLMQTMYRGVIARKELKQLKLEDRSVKLIQSNARGRLGRNRANLTRKNNAIYAALKTKMGASSSVVKSLIEGSGTTESLVAAAETLSSVAESAAGGTALVFDTDAPMLILEKMINSQRLSLTLNKTKSGKSDWTAFIRLMGNLNLQNQDMRDLIMVKEGGKTMINMLRRGDSAVREEACNTLKKMAKDKGLRYFFVFDLQVVPLLVHMIRSSNHAEHEHENRRNSGLVREMSLLHGGVQQSGGEGGGSMVGQRGHRRVAQHPEEEDAAGEADAATTAYSTTHKLVAVNLLQQIMCNNKDSEIKLVLGRCGVIPNLVRTVKALVDSHKRLPASKDRSRLLERSAKAVWRLIEEKENFERSLSRGTGECLHAMLESTWKLANRLGCVLVACMVGSSEEAKVMLQEANVPTLLNMHMVSNSADVRGAALVAIEAFSLKAEAAPAAAAGGGGEKPQLEEFPDPTSFSLARPRGRLGLTDSTIGGDFDKRIPQNMSREVGDEILLVKEPVGVSLRHEGTSISDTAQYLKLSALVKPNAKHVRLESSIHDEVPWTN